MTEWVKTERGWRKSYGAPKTFGPRSSLPMPRVVSDSMDPTEHIDGKYYDSKSAFRAVTKAHGCVEVGNDPARLRPPEKPQRDTRKFDAAIHRAIAALD